MNISDFAVPSVVAFVALVSLVQRVDLFGEFIEGAKEGLATIKEIFPSLLALVLAVGMFRASGGLDLLCGIVSPVAELVGFPSECTPLLIMRPFSGSGSVAIFPYHIFNITGQKVPVSLTELAKANGKSAGVVTTDRTSGATPSAFSTHVLSRKFEKTISSQQLKSNLDLLWGCESDSITKEKCEKNGFSFVQTATQMEALESGSRSFAQFDFDEMKYCTGEKDTPSIEQMTKKAIDLLDDNENGFFLMVEGACIDKFSHDNELDNATMNVVEFDKAVGYALDYAAKDGDTLVVVTADHETGGIKYNGVTDEYYYTSDSHTTADVPLYVSATDAGFTDGEAVENRQISVQIARVMGYGKDQFPAVKGYTM